MTTTYIWTSLESIHTDPADGASATPVTTLFSASVDFGGISKMSRKIPKG